ELLEIERVATALLVKQRCISGGHRLAEKRSRLFGGERGQLDPRQSGGAMAGNECGRRTRGDPARPGGGRDEHGPRGRGPGRRSNAASNSTEASSAQWKSSSTRTSGFVSASCSRRARTARWLR